MSSDDFSTVSMRRGDRAREIEVLRQHYRDHRDHLMRMISEAPSEHLATEYQRLVRDIDGSLAKLDELEGRGATAAGAATAATVATAAAAAPVRDPLLNQKTEPGTRQLVTPPPPPPRLDAPYDAAPAPASSSSRMLMIVVAGVLVLGAIGYLIWRASRDRRAERPVVAETTSTSETTRTTATAPPPIAPAPGTEATTAAGAVLSVAPAVADYGTIRKGTRAVRQLEVTNTTSQAMTYAVARSQCRCLYYDYTGKLGPKKKETLTVTVDGAKAKSGSLAETIEITSKQNPSAKASFQVNATVQ